MAKSKTRKYVLSFEVTGPRVTFAQMEHYLTYWIDGDGEGIEKFRMKVSKPKVRGTNAAKEAGEARGK